MKIAVRYHTRSGNTEKLARAVAEAAGVPAETIAVPLSERVDLLLLGCSYYAFDMDEAVKRFITDNEARIAKIACFGTSAMMKSMRRPMRRQLRNTKIELSDAEFHCRGQFYRANPGRPNGDDLAAAAEFARELIEN